MSHDASWDDDDYNDLSALDFSSEASEIEDDVGYYGGATTQDFQESPDADDDSDDAWASSALAEFPASSFPASSSEMDAEDVLNALSAATAESEEISDDDGSELFTVTNPPETVAVSSLIGGRIERVRLAPHVVRMSEAALAEEIRVLADLARVKGLAGQWSYLAENEFVSAALNSFGVDAEEVLDALVDDAMPLATPERSAEKQAEVFADRYRVND